MPPLIYREFRDQSAGGLVVLSLAMVNLTFQRIRSLARTACSVALMLLLLDEFLQVDYIYTPGWLDYK